jgi:hypothetical protein
MYIQYIQDLFQSRLGTADYALVTSSLHYHDSLHTWTVVHMTTAKFKPLIFSVSGFALSSVANIFIFMILDDFYLLPAWFCYVIIHVRNLKSLMHISNPCEPRKFANGTENPVFQALQTCHYGCNQTLWRVNYILALNRPLLKGEYILMNVLPGHRLY